MIFFLFYFQRYVPLNSVFKKEKTLSEITKNVLTSFDSILMLVRQCNFWIQDWFLDVSQNSEESLRADFGLVKSELQSHVFAESAMLLASPGKEFETEHTP